jgi:thiosulfate reductase cytochrome b subunit
VNGAIEAEAAAAEDASPGSEPAASAPATKTRMGGGAAAKTRMGGAPASTTHAEARQAPAAKTRMGGTASAPAAKTRMGGAPASPAAATEPATETEPAVAAPTGTRMGTPSRMGAPAAPSAQSAATPPVTPSLSAPQGRAGTPGPAGAATPAQPARSWVKPVVITASLVVLAVVVVLGARWLRTLEPIQEFISSYDGHASQPDTAPAGIPGWLGWQHFLNMFFIVLIIRTGLAVRTERKPPGYWTANQDSFFSPQGNTPKKVSLSQWLHQCLDVLWVVNGLIFVVLLFATGHWMRIVPTSWDIVPNMVSGAIQYASLDWPVENGWVHYNALQVMAYFTTVFIAAPLAIATGIRFSTWWPEKAERLSKLYPVEWARALHFPVMLYFVAFTIVHVFLVFFTGALANLNHMYTSRDVVDWWGLVIFLASILVIAAAWFLAKPMFTTPIAARMGKVSK